MTRRAVLAVAAALALLPVAPSGAVPCATTTGAFRSTKYPQFPGEETPAHGGFAVGAYDARRVYVASQKQLLQSLDGGCTWFVRFTVPDTPTAEQPYRSANMALKGVRTAASPAAGKRVHVFLQEVAGYGRPYVYTSTDGTGGWTAATGLPPTGRIVDLVTAPSDPNVVYTTILTGLTFLPTTFASNDGGRSFTRVTPPGVAAQSKAWFLAVDPANAKRLWATGNSALSVSADGGATWTVVPNVTGTSQVTTLRGPRTAVLAVAGGEAPRVYLSTDAGATWTATVAPGGIQSADFGATAKDVYALSYSSGKTDVWRYDAKLKRFVRAATKTPVPAFFAMERENGRRPAFWSWALNTAIVRWAP